MASICGQIHKEVKHINVTTHSRFPFVRVETSRYACLLMPDHSGGFVEHSKVFGPYSRFRRKPMEVTKQVNYVAYLSELLVLYPDYAKG